MEKQKLADMEGQIRGIKAKDIMSRFAVTVKEEDTLVDVAHMMMRMRISGCPVVSSVGKLAGIITVTDLCKAMEGLVSQSAAHMQINEKSLIRDIMTRTVQTIAEETDLYDIIQLMHDRNIHTLPVMGNNAIAGIVGRRDVIHAYYSLFTR